MFRIKRSSLLLLVFIFTAAIGFSQTNFLQNSSFENWSGNPETPDNWDLVNPTSILKNNDASDGNYSLELELSNSLSNPTEIRNQLTLETSTTYTYTFDYKALNNIGNNLSADLYILKDNGNFTVQYRKEFVPFETDGNWHTISIDVETDSFDEDYIFELSFRANTTPTSEILIDNLRILGSSAPDADNDGVPDASDQCPNTSANALAVDDNGCEVSIDQSNILTDPSFEDWSLGGGANLADWGILVQAGGWNKNSDINDNLQYSVELTTSSTGSNFASIFQNDVQLYKDVPYNISIDYKVIEGTFNELELEFAEGIFADTVEKFTLTNFQMGWNTYSATFTPTENQLVDFRIDVSSNQPEGKILLDNSTINATIGDNGPDADNDGVNDSADNCPNTPNGESVNENGCSQSQLDDDNDGVNNSSDTCPNTPSGALVDVNGCSDSQLDDDNDGVTNDNDTCPNTPSGVSVDSEGCAQDQTSLPNIPSNGIQVKTTSTSCTGSANGEITVSFDPDYSYTVQIKANLLDKTFDNVTNANGLVRSNLPADTYSVCITIPEFPSFEQCFTVVIETPEDLLSGKTIVNNTSKVGSLIVSGSKNYEVLVNDRKLNFSFGDTGRNELTFELQDGANNILIKTDKNCQGEFAETVMLNSVRVFPNPTTESVTILGLKNDVDATIRISNMSGVLIKSYSTNISNASADINVAELSEGMYLVRVKSNQQDVQTKIVKR